MKISSYHLLFSEIRRHILQSIVYKRLKPSQWMDYFSCHNSEHQVRKDELFFLRRVWEKFLPFCMMILAHQRHKTTLKEDGEHFLAAYTAVFFSFCSAGSWMWFYLDELCFLVFFFFSQPPINAFESLTIYWILAAFHSIISLAEDIFLQFVCLVRYCNEVTQWFFHQWWNNPHDLQITLVWNSDCITLQKDWQIGVHKQ